MSFSGDPASEYFRTNPLVAVYHAETNWNSGTAAVGRFLGKVVLGLIWLIIRAIIIFIIFLWNSGLSWIARIPPVDELVEMASQSEVSMVGRVFIALVMLGLGLWIYISHNNAAFRRSIILRTASVRPVAIDGALPGRTSIVKTFLSWVDTQLDREARFTNRFLARVFNRSNYQYLWPLALGFLSLLSQYIAMGDPRRIVLEPNSSEWESVASMVQLAAYNAGHWLAVFVITPLVVLYYSYGGKAMYTVILTGVMIYFTRIAIASHNIDRSSETWRTAWKAAQASRPAIDPNSRWIRQVWGFIFGLMLLMGTLSEILRHFLRWKRSPSNANRIMTSNGSPRRVITPGLENVVSPIVPAPVIPPAQLYTPAGTSTAPPTTPLTPLHPATTLHTPGIIVAPVVTPGISPPSESRDEHFFMPLLGLGPKLDVVGYFFRDWFYSVSEFLQGILVGIVSVFNARQYFGGLFIATLFVWREPARIFACYVGSLIQSGLLWTKEAIYELTKEFFRGLEARLWDPVVAFTAGFFMWFTRLLFDWNFVRDRKSLIALIVVLVMAIVRHIRLNRSNTPSKAPVVPTYAPTDVTVIIPTRGKRTFEDAEFMKGLSSILAEEPAEVIITTNGSMDNHRSMNAICGLFGTHRVRVTSVHEDNLRRQFLKATNQTTTKVICYAHTRVGWPQGFLKDALVPFEDQTVGLVGIPAFWTRSLVRSNQLNRDDQNGDIESPPTDDRGIVGRFLDYVVSASLFHNNRQNATDIPSSNSTVSGRTALIRTEIVQSPAFRFQFMQETYNGKPPPPSSIRDDAARFISRFVSNAGFKTTFCDGKPDSPSRAFIEVPRLENPTLSAYCKKLVAEYRSSYRQELTSVFSYIPVLVRALLNWSLLNEFLICLLVWKAFERTSILRVLLVALFIRKVLAIGHSGHYDAYLRMQGGLGSMIASVVFSRFCGLFKLWAFLTPWVYRVEKTEGDFFSPPGLGRRLVR
ncbi:polysaccharide synthase Cps1p [Drepanopeziza brunnea f. sp. 'multigermtubi' MB_m1]|uniref:Polysaccharide synthase Cps1p n=1 Tax=Marssonina brunnea f. sp. multigermtubi (strain MB_m1) TaxID=1072389 RepID=K1XP57_MARBU|nr:polysaccharide synthase Cps1p [Drepanopeziza brunnea f. sp. 'multigermtubi' MB_m1]EKD14269.1 polysaccharide synthase Cps1p [Drepanopeziza brunnea f. sp. 'multigermtubi' MB_m1]